MDERPTKRRGPLTWLAARTWRLWLIVAFSLPVLYVACLGPAAALLRSNVLPIAANEALVGLYSPFEWLMDRDETPEWLRRAIQGYVGVWVTPMHIYLPPPAQPAEVPEEEGEAKEPPPPPPDSEPPPS